MAVWPEEKVFKDPVHKYIYVQEPAIWDLINTKEFQRLRRIRQLGASFFTFHGAEHSRFSHSLGVYEIARKIIHQFERNGFSDWPREEGLLCMCAALLHDIGHGPFSHSIETVFGEHHEAWSCRIVQGDTEVNRVLRRIDPSFPDRVAAVICKTYPQEIVVSLVSSQLDADRMDYLLRDAYCTGVNYGMYDLERILRVIRPHRGDIVVKESGMHAVEDYLTSRYQMYWQVYFHPVTRSSEIVLRNIFARAKAIYDAGDGETLPFLPEPLRRLFEGRLDVEHYLALDEALVQAAFSLWANGKDEILSDLCKRFLHRKLFQYATPIRMDEALLERLRESIRREGYDPDYYLQVDFPKDLSYDVYRSGAASRKKPIYLLKHDGGLTEISEVSDIVRSISGTQYGRHRIYVPERILEPGNPYITAETAEWLKGE